MRDRDRERPQRTRRVRRQFARVRSDVSALAQLDQVVGSPSGPGFFSVIFPTLWHCFAATPNTWSSRLPRSTSGMRGQPDPRWTAFAGAVRAVGSVFTQRRRRRSPCHRVVAQSVRAG